MKTSTFLLTSSFILLTSSFSRAAERAEVPEQWRHIPICGRTFYNGNLGFNEDLWALLDTYPDEPMSRNVWLELGSFRWTANDIQVKSVLGRDGDVATNLIVRLQPPTNPLEKPPVKIENLLRRNAYDKRIARFKEKRPGCPISLGCGMRPVWPMKDAFDCDTAGFEKWCAANPEFIGFVAFDEVDHDTHCILNNWRRQLFRRPEDRAWLDEHYPASKWLNADYTPWYDTLYRKARAYHFGTDKLQGLWANLPSMAFNLARQNLKVLWYEAEMQMVGAPWRWGGLYTRGAARQFHTPFGWYTASFSLAQVVRPEFQETARQKGLTGGGGFVPYWPCRGRPKGMKYCGAAQTLIKRNMFYGCAIGAVGLVCEGGSVYLTAIDPADPKRVILSPYGEDLRDLFRWEASHDRGVAYTPVALLVSNDEHTDRQGKINGYNHDRFSLIAFLTTLCCPHLGNEFCEDRKNGDQGQMFNSEFGEFVDALSPDTRQKSEDFYRALKAYKAAILCGWFNAAAFDRAALERYVREGGVVYAENRHVEMGLIPAAIEGAKGKIVLTDTFLDPSVTDGKGDWYWQKQHGMFGGTVTNPKIAALFRNLQDAYLPVKVEGDIQWGVNLVEGQSGEGQRSKVRGQTEEGSTIHCSTFNLQPPTSNPHWLVWLINNKGVKKFLYEPDEIDLSKTANVKITDKKTGKVYTATVEPGGFTTIEIPFD